MSAADSRSHQERRPGTRVPPPFWQEICRSAWNVGPEDSHSFDLVLCVICAISVPFLAVRQRDDFACLCQCAAKKRTPVGLELRPIEALETLTFAVRADDFL